MKERAIALAPLTVSELREIALSRIRQAALDVAPRRILEDLVDELATRAAPPDEKALGTDPANDHEIPSPGE